MNSRIVRAGLILLLIMAVSLEALSQNRRKKSETSTPDIPAALYSSMEYRLVGPFRGGRSAAVTGIPGNPNLFYFGATGGGVWKTTDGGRSWSNISDGYFGGSVGAVEVAKSDPNVIYVGGGEKTVRGNVSSGYGVWKSTDAGRSWERAGLAKSRHIPRLKVHPTDYNTVYAAVLGNIYKPTKERGIYKSTDGGKSWNQILFVNEQAGGCRPGS